MGLTACLLTRTQSSVTVIPTCLRIVRPKAAASTKETAFVLVARKALSTQHAVMELLGTRRADCRKMETRGSYTHMEFTIPSRALIGLRTRLMNATAGEAIMHHNFYEYEYLRGSVPQRNVGVMISHETGQVTAYALDALADCGVMFVAPGEQTYEGQIVGEHCKEGDPGRAAPAEGRAIAARSRSHGDLRRVPDHQRLPRKEAHQHPRRQRRQNRGPQAPPPDEPRTGPRIHRRRRNGRSDAGRHPPAQAHAQGSRPQTRRPANVAPASLPAVSPASQPASSRHSGS